MATDSTVIDVEKTLANLTVPQKVKLLAGLGWWHTEPVPEAGIQPIRMSDGPNGVRGTRFFNGVPSSCFPSSTGLGSSFDIDLAEQVGKALADECIAKSLYSRNLSRQSKKVAATIKHFAANDQEYQRFSIDSVVSERALREIYLKPFQIAMKKSNPIAFMTAYNRVNGTHASEHPWLLQKVLREEWGFKGLVMSDWTGVYSTTESIKAGVDLEMPGPTIVRGAALERALTGEKIFIEDINERVRKV
ncbi:hypothetical protein EWM64_g9751 [Hericium alpestre]|uniref:beta-glucosidase n=1 Tax=Hericium alpestre TaxID=135208 RepID=A0A4Y9ZK82_9AGAM|nr:hypothetical protein EWM64_g9751 [Hericium alpestre]